uniref:Solute carrier family 40 protein n=1 Tax=Rhabditophanes sp. KR3021 TaxID=114890 RepID=A0AC35UI65_9BILA
MYGGLQLIAISQLVNNICIVVFASPLGNYLDKKDKLHAIKIALYLNNTFIIICATLYFLVSFFNLDNNSSFYIYMIYGGIVCNAISEVASLAEKNILSKDWLMIITENDAKDLGKKNATLNILDQATCLISPLLIGFLLIYVEYGYMSCPGLHTDPSLLKIYFSQSTAKVAIALSFLYMTVLAFDGLSIGYAKAQNTSETILGVFRSVSALTGIIGAFFYMKLESKIGASLTSVVGSFCKFLIYCKL